MPPAPLILVIEGCHQVYVDALQAAGFRVVTSPSVKEALEGSHEPDVVIAELVVPVEELPRLSQSFRSGARTRAMTVLVLAEAEAEQSIRGVGAAFCRHPCPPEELVEIVKGLLNPAPPS